MMVWDTEILSASQSIVVVTSPTGLQAPPAFAAITTRPPIACRKCLSPPATWRSNFNETIVAVRLSIMALRKKVIKHKMGINGSVRPPVTCKIKRVTTSKPSKWSIDSTTPMAGNKNRMMAPTSFKPCSSSSFSASWFSCDSRGWKPTARKVHIEADTISMTADLFTPTWSSSTTRTSPIKKSAVIKFALVVTPSMASLGAPMSAMRTTITMKMTPDTFSVRRAANATWGFEGVILMRSELRVDFLLTAGCTSTVSAWHAWPPSATASPEHDLTAAPISACKALDVMLAHQQPQQGFL
mmetsp:Transcript_95548/g.240761  ORF Transcript_95548/g.240761 Transcript_95548/m.240761 type:complete len:298 (+) Transcript_95548:637-1530(+)